MDEAKKKNGKKVADIIVNTVIWIVVIFSAIVTFMAFSAQGSEDGVPEMFGKSLISIQTPSMEPTYKVGDMVLITKLSKEAKAELKAGDIITYHAPIDINGDGMTGDINTHRIFEISDSGAITTKGDGNEMADTYTVTAADVIGTSEEKDAIPVLGAVLDFLSSSVGFLLCVVIPLVLFFLYELYRFISLVVTERAKKAPVSKETEEEIKRRAIEEYLRTQGAEVKSAETEAEAEAETEAKAEAEAESDSEAEAETDSEAEATEEK